MIFGFGRKQAEEPDSGELEIETVLFKGAVNGREVDLAKNARLAQVGLVPAKELISDALARRAEMIQVLPKGNAAAVTLYVDGVPYPGERLPKQESLAITQILKLLAGLDITERKRPQSGGIKSEYQEHDYHMLIDTTPLKTGGERLIVRSRPLEGQPETPEDLGFSERLRERIRALTSQRQGVVLACGPPNSGVTTLSFGVIRSIDAYLYSIFSLADFGGRSLVHITSPDPVAGEDFEQALARCIRSEADVVIVDPVNNVERLKSVFGKADQVSIVSELKAKDAAHGIESLSKVLGKQLVADRLSLILSQKLIRMLCKECKEAYKPNPKLIQKVGLPPETKVLYRPPRPNEAGEEPDLCHRCGGIGYYGRVGLIEAIQVTDEIKPLILQEADARTLKNAARKAGMQSFQSDGLRLVAEGKTSLEELQRAFKS
jgi:type II secretory ATPase GspE/PulE/Tfp pilus assembly ATPase PilB-like protein